MTQISEITNKKQSTKLKIYKLSSKFKSYNSQIPSSKLNKQITMSIPDVSHKQHKVNNNVSNNTTNTINHQHQSFGYLGWVPQRMMININNILIIVSRIAKKKKKFFVIDCLFHSGVTVKFLNFSHLPSTL